MLLKKYARAIEVVKTKTFQCSRSRCSLETSVTIWQRLFGSNILWFTIL